MLHYFTTVGREDRVHVTRRGVQFAAPVITLRAIARALAVT
jgi:hypothetical protein